MIIFLYGPDTYRSRQKLNEIIEHYKKVHKSGLNLKYFDASELSYQDFKDELQQIPMFQEKKLVVLTNLFSNPELKEKLTRFADRWSHSKDIILIHEKGEIPKDEPILQYAKSQEFKPLEGQRLKNWAKKEFESYGLDIESKALNRLIDYVGSDLWRLSNEIKKLVNYKKPTVHTQGKTIELKDIDLLVKPKIETDIFKTVDAIASKNKKQALFLLHKHLEKGDSPLYLLSMINFQFRNLLMVKTSQKPDLHPYIIKKASWQARKFSFEDLKKIYQKIFQADLGIKTGKIEPETALDMLIAEI